MTRISPDQRHGAGPGLALVASATQASARGGSLEACRKTRPLLLSSPLQSDTVTWIVPTDYWCAQVFNFPNVVIFLTNKENSPLCPIANQVIYR